MASEYGVTSKSSVGETPAIGQHVMLRTELPQASRVVRPASERIRIAGSTSCSFTKWNWMFCRVVMWPNPREIDGVGLLDRVDHARAGARGEQRQNAHTATKVEHGVARLDASPDGGGEVFDPFVCVGEEEAMKIERA